MEQAQCWMWTKQKQSLSPKNQESTTKRSYEDVSWEEQAFAEDAAGPLGGCIWPPRSYSCSFCRREFRSAQALGGHMNVHRRDRAILKQSASPHNEFPNHHSHQDNHNHVQYPCTSFGGQYPSSQVCALVYNNPNPNSDFNSRVSAPSTKDNCGENTLVVPPPSPRSWSNFVSGRYSRACASDSKAEEDKKARIIESGCRATADYVKPDLSVCLNLLVCRKRPTMSDEEEDSFSSKRNRTDASPLPFFLQSSTSKVLELSPSSLEDLDLELRLGDPPQQFNQRNNMHVYYSYSSISKDKGGRHAHLNSTVILSPGNFWKKVPLRREFKSYPTIVSIIR